MLPSPMKSAYRRATGTAVFASLALGLAVTVGCGDGGGSSSPVTPTPTPTPPTPAPTPPEPEPEPPYDPFASWNDLPAESWWLPSEPYSCAEAENPDSPWVAAGLPDPGGSDPLSLIRYYGNGTYLRYGNMGFGGCTPTTRDPNGYHLDPPADPTYFSLGDLEIIVDLARVPVGAADWFQDDGRRVDFSLSGAVSLLNRHVAAYYRRISENRLRLTFRAGEEFTVPGDGSPEAANLHQYQLAGACLEGCEHGAPGGLNRILLHDVARATGGYASNGRAFLGLANFPARSMGTIVHEIGHGWMSWPHSFVEVPWKPYPSEPLDLPNPYSNRYDIMSGSSFTGWDAGMLSTLALNRYAAGWIDPEEVVLHLDETATYTLVPPRRPGHQFLVVNSGRRHAFTTIEVLDDIGAAYRVTDRIVHDPSAPRGSRPLRYEGVLITRYDQTAGTGIQARLGPAFYNEDNPDFLEDVGWGRDDHSLLVHGESRDIGDGVTAAVARNSNGSYDVTVSGGRTAGFERWCYRLWFAEELFAFDTGCFLDTATWE